MKKAIKVIGKNGKFRLYEIKSGNVTKKVYDSLQAAEKACRRENRIEESGCSKMNWID